MTAERMATLREELAGATCADERLPVLAEMVELAAELRQAGRGDAASAAAGLDEALRQLGEFRELSASAEPPVDQDDYAFTLYLIAQACLLRDTGSDLDDAIACLRELRDGLLAEPLPDLEEIGDPEEIPDPDEIMAEIEVSLAQALFERLSRPGGDVADLDDASAVLTAALGRMASDAPARLALTLALALQYATRFVGYSGTQDHRRAALALAAEALASPDPAEDVIAACHVIVAWMILTRQMTSEQRSGMLRKPEMEAARRGVPEATAMIEAMGDVQIDLSDAQTALSHLRQVPDAASLDGDLSGIAPALSSLAHLAIMRAGQVGEDVDRVAGQLQSVARQHPPDTIEQGELLAMRAALLAGRASSDGHQDELRPAAEALQEAAVGLPEGHPVRGPLLNQLAQSLCQQLDQAESADDIAAEVERIVVALEQMPRDDPQFAQMLMLVGVIVLNMQLSHRDVVPLDRLITHLEQTVSRLAPDDPMRSFGESMYWSAIGVQGAKQDRPDLMDTAMDGLIRCADRVPAENVFRPMALLGVAFVLTERYIMRGEIRHAEQADTYIRDACAASGAAGILTEPNPGYPMLVHLRTVLAVARAKYDPQQSGDMTETVAILERAVSLMKPADPLRPRLIADLETVRATHILRQSLAGPGIPLVQPAQEAFDKILVEAQNMNRDHSDFPTLAAQAASGLMLRALADGDIVPIGKAISLLAEACAVPSLTYRERPRMLNVLGMTLLTRYGMTRDPRDLSHAIDRLEEARRAVEQELGSPYAASVLQSLASAYRTRGDAARGDVDRAVGIGLGALRERAGDVLLQDSDENALRAARWDTSEAGEMARWFLWRGRPGAAIEALELGRGTVLHAATLGSGLAEALEDAGHANLAAEWARSMPRGEAPDSDAAGDLRYRIMMAIEGSRAEARLLAPPSLDEITAALKARKVDGLVYLLPRGEDGPGLAVLIDSGGSVRPLSLPSLQAGPGTPVDSFLQARRAGEENWRTALGELCDWTWRAAIGPVLGAIPARSRGSRRIVLVAGGELGLVAWHAARQPVAGSYRYAMQEAVFSYASSARQFVSTARLEPRPWAQAPVLISDALASAYATELGICHLYTAHYPAASVFGSAHVRLAPSGFPGIPGAAAATSANVLAALPRGACPGASMLHFGCHGAAQVPILTSHLTLDSGEEDGADGGADQNNKKVAVRDILQQARKRSGKVSGGLVVLASCLTDVAEADYDEAVTLATAFLSVGAAGVVAARWKVPDRDTALFMAAFHHYLNGSDRYPAQALRSAQVWMLDPGREPLGPLPTILRDETAQPDLANPVAWAGFAYQGW
jgi:hypothetical protein